MKPIRIVTRSSVGGDITPLRFQMEGENETLHTVLVEKILKCEEVKITGSRYLLYLCRSLVDDRMRQFELGMDLLSCRWYLTRW
ncbi:MAG: hypothetical protein FWE76_07470 [Symbiobacteriaceae bacterium]|nr:hypothetical protein [Symbiobacteriaceae bacterium]